ncbi:MFS transporter [Reyranella sp. CPCC 100927]|uniref:MFS transporter n=1 Tax=Reyranella sp. CPCC 100927 TaxID=2599616 RepID=UPI0011B7EB33|nr:MFS transporter [Reyranella sp. CPCC 100927]TWT00664.1 MHS family MFS transporter [Reyranella sp. CPCC 100927]
MAIATAGAIANPEAQNRTRVILASAIGSALEWYDFFIYGMAAALVFGELFFPKSDPTVGTLLAFATFGVGFFARPLGGLVFGHFGDKIGRKPMLVITLLLVGFGTMLIGFLPTYDQIGIWAPILLILLRLIQGFGAGAEYGGAVILLVESAPHGKRGFWGSWAPIGVSVGNLLAAGVFYIVSELPRDQLLSWGWRIPFLVSIVLILVGLYIRANVMETPVFTKAVAKRQPEKAPVWQALRRQPRNFFVLVGARIAENGLGYLIPVFGLNYVVNNLGVPRSTALTALMVAFGIELVALLGFSMLSDRIGRRPVYIFGALFSAALAFPFFWLVGTKEAFFIAIAFILARAVGTAAMFGPQAAYFAELFGPTRRFSGFAFARELGSIIAGGPAPFLAAYFVLLAGGQTWAVSLYMIVLSLITAVAVWMGPETYRDDISEDAPSSR